MKRIFSVVLFLSANAWSQGDSIMSYVNLQLGKRDGEYVLVDIPKIQTAVVLQRFPTIAYCPTGRGADFALKKYVTQMGRSGIIEEISDSCKFTGKVTINSEAIYEIHTALGKKYFMQLREKKDSLITVKITEEMPVSLRNMTSFSINPVDPNEYLINGKKLETKTAPNFRKVLETNRK